MPGQFLSQLERERLQSFPDEITINEVITFFTLSDKDLTLVKKRSGDHNLLGFALRYSYLRQFVPTFLAAFSFSSNRQPDNLIEAIKIIRNLDTLGKRKVPDNTSLKFVPKRWSEYVINPEGKIVRKYYELCALWELRTALRSGNIWLSNSRRYANPESYLIPKNQWLKLKSEVLRQIQVSEVATHTIELKKQELSQLLSEFNATFQDNEQVRIEKNKLVVSPLKAEEVPDSTKQLRKQIRERLPWIELTNLIIFP